MQSLALSLRQYLELEKIGLGAFAPLTGFMDEGQFHSVVDTMHLPDNNPFPLPVVLDLDSDSAKTLPRDAPVTLSYNGEEVGQIAVGSVYSCDKEAAAEKVFGTGDRRHPGVDHFYRMGDYFVGGEVLEFLPLLPIRVIVSQSRYYPKSFAISNHVYHEVQQLTMLRPTVLPRPS